MASSLLEDSSFKYVKESLEQQPEENQQWLDDLVNFINDASTADDDSFFYDMLEFVRFLVGNPDSIAYTDPSGRIFLNAPGKPGKDKKVWEFIYDHECMHQLWETFEVEKEIEKKYGSCNHTVLNVASDCIINDYLIHYRNKKFFEGGITPEYIEETYGVHYSRRDDTQFTLYEKLMDHVKDIEQDPRCQIDDPQQQQGGDDGVSGGGGGGNQPNESWTPEAVEGYKKGWDRAQEVISKYGLEKGIEILKSETPNLFSEALSHMYDLLMEAGTITYKTEKQGYYEGINSFVREYTNKMNGKQNNSNSSPTNRPDMDRHLDNNDNGGDNKDNKEDKGPNDGKYRKNGKDDKKDGEGKDGGEKRPAMPDPKISSVDGGDKDGNMPKSNKDGKDGKGGKQDKNGKDGNGGSEGDNGNEGGEGKDGKGKNSDGTSGKPGKTQGAMSEDEREFVEQHRKEIISKYKSILSGALGQFVSQCKSSKQTNPDGMKTKTIQKGLSWKEEMTTQVNAYIKKQVFSKQREYKKTYSRLKRGIGPVKMGDFFQPGHIAKKDKLVIDTTFYVDCSGSMETNDRIKNAWSAAFMLAEQLENRYKNERVVSKVASVFWGFNRQLQKTEFKKPLKPYGGTFDFEELLEKIKEESGAAIINIIITDGETNVSKSECEKFLKELDGMFVVITCKPNAQLRAIGEEHKDDKKLIYIDADSAFSLK